MSIVVNPQPTSCSPQEVFLLNLSQAKINTIMCPYNILNYQLLITKY